VKRLEEISWGVLRERLGCLLRAGTRLIHRKRKGPKAYGTTRRADAFAMKKRTFREEKKKKKRGIKVGRGGEREGKKKKTDGTKGRNPRSRFTCKVSEKKKNKRGGGMSKTENWGITLQKDRTNTSLNLNQDKKENVTKNQRKGKRARTCRRNTFRAMQEKSRVSKEAEKETQSAPGVYFRGGPKQTHRRLNYGRPEPSSMITLWREKRILLRKEGMGSFDEWIHGYRLQ